MRANRQAAFRTATSFSIKARNDVDRRKFPIKGDVLRIKLKVTDRLHRNRSDWAVVLLRRFAFRRERFDFMLPQINQPTPEVDNTLENLTLLCPGK
jgi:hypothetical protein